MDEHEKRWQFQKCKLMFDIVNGISPSYLQDMFTQSAATHCYSTRIADTRGLVVPKVKTEMVEGPFPLRVQ